MPTSPLPQDPADAACEEELVSLRLHFEALQADALAGAEAILGGTFDKTDRESQEDLTKSIGPAIGAAEFQMIGTLQSAKRLQTLGRLTESELTSAESLVEALVQQANEIAELEEKKDVAARIRLYAKVANWLKDADPRASDVTECPVCKTSLTGKADEVTRRPIVEHIRESLRRDTTHLEHAISAWARRSLDRLAGELAAPLSSERSQDLPEHPADLMSKALSEELFAMPAFSRTLAPLKTSVQRLCEHHLPVRATFSEPAAVDFPNAVAQASRDLVDAIAR